MCGQPSALNPLISQKLRNLFEGVSKLQSSIPKDVDLRGTDICVDDLQAISVLPETLYQYSQLLNNLSEEWDKLLLTSDDLGTVTSYDGSVFNPQEVSLVLVIHCIISDMEMLLADINELLSAAPVNYTDFINNVYFLIALPQFLCQMTQKEDSRVFPSQSIESHLKTMTQKLPNFFERLQINTNVQ
ncbi:PREDICTED: uncharacterized protein LOC109583460 [Amphimedon queenslandica]|uniref:Uncharacterized protein n=1 Tax=Amphimedon queenslandica TaxID=400682 RepID=A0A1X7UGE4_AMPQE|nr:PREDICTED: uncharacterized protein LOC109583460 [Amphimedon queenslandica]XP_019854386.1 PREDICTED: uncharacterized protein LOC109583460 [Amphimedon queenslandica]XP_019854387.1 PREDICTED: uncharacterized protein LOC109583460 [Amphimedon queenslandica]|eukprot:XP_019854385.1 PREDICTED: uncharacterized protein LOC109583460 [Amphimedon queenslandica]